MEEIGARDEADVDEREVEQAIIQNVKNFIMTFGRDFAFVGNQYRFVEFLIQGYDNPMGVATYMTAEDVRKISNSFENEVIFTIKIVHLHSN